MDKNRLLHFWVIYSIQGKSKLKLWFVELVVSTGNHFSFCAEDLTLVTSNQINKGKVKSHERKANPFGRLSLDLIEDLRKLLETTVEKSGKKVIKTIPLWKKKRLKKGGLKKEKISKRHLRGWIASPCVATLNRRRRIMPSSGSRLNH